MIKIKEIKGFKYIGDAPRELDNSPYPSNFRKNMTYMKLRFSKWEEDREMLEFIGLHVPVVEDIKEYIDEGNYDLSKDLHIIIRQDDDKEQYRGQELMMFTDKKPKNIDKYIREQKLFWEDFEKGYHDRQEQKRFDYLERKRKNIRSK